MEAGRARRVADHGVDHSAQDAAADTAALLALGTAAIVILARLGRRSRHLAEQAAELRLRGRGRKQARRECCGSREYFPCHLIHLCRSEEHTSELQSLMRISYAVFCLKKKTTTKQLNITFEPLNN